MKSAFLSLLLVLVSLLSYSQDFLPCLNHGSYNQLEYNAQNTKALNKAFKSNDIIKIPVVIHVVHDGIPNLGVGGATLYEDNIPDENIYRQMEQLNKDFRFKNEDAQFIVSQFIDRATDTKIEFVLAEIDPDGNETNGIDRVFYPGLSHTGFANNYEIENVIKPSTIWDPTQYFNIWTIRFTESTETFALLGYAQFPDSSKLAGMPADNNPQRANTDGVVVNPVVFGVPPEDDVFNNNNRTLTHEIGHSFGLRHIWGDGNCNADDFVEDTPFASSSSAGCQLDRWTCDNLNMVQNYMDYTNGSCQNLFTHGQLARITQVLNVSPRRRELKDSPVIDRSITSITEKQSTVLKLGPNPFKNFLELKGALSTAPIDLYTMQGEKINVDIEGTRINTSNLPAGSYILVHQQHHWLVVKP